MTNDSSLPVLADREVDVTQVKGASKRQDWIAHSPPPGSAVEQPDFVDRLRWFFAEMDAEVDRYRNDPIATAAALARLEALLGDVRYVRDRLKDTTAASMDKLRVRRLTVEGVTTVEASSEIRRTNWQHERLLHVVLVYLLGHTIVRTDTGDMIPVNVLADDLTEFMRPEWKLTALREQSINPDDYCDIDRDDDGKIVKTPTVRITDNRIRGRR